MRGYLLAAVAMLAVTVSAQDRGTTGSLERPFSVNGLVKMDLSAGDYHITGSPESRVRLDWSVRDTEALAKVRATADVRNVGHQGSSQAELSITTDGPSSKGLRFNIQVPSQSDLYVRLSAGDLTIEDIRGNKDVELRAGDLRIDVGRADHYKRVDASLWAGDIKASAFQIFKGGLFRSFDWSGDGAYRLHAHLMAGDLYLYSKEATR
jgi:hypothetical protein